MAYKISDDCIACGACAAECPVEAISEGDGKFVIDADTCIECGACAGVCPVGAPQQASSARVNTSRKRHGIRAAFHFERNTYGSHTEPGRTPL